MPLKKSDYMSDIWRDGIFGESHDRVWKLN
jgi:hypothetical protein